MEVVFCPDVKTLIQQLEYMREVDTHSLDFYNFSIQLYEIITDLETKNLNRLTTWSNSQRVVQYLVLKKSNLLNRSA